MYDPVLSVGWSPMRRRTDTDEMRTDRQRNAAGSRRTRSLAVHVDHGTRDRHVLWATDGDENLSRRRTQRDGTESHGTDDERE